jgi:hypothetical protein
MNVRVYLWMGLEFFESGFSLPIRWPSSTG